MWKDKNFKILFLVVLFLAICLRFVYLAKIDVLPDEPLYIVRSLGWIDILAHTPQTTPVDWYPNGVPSWTKISFHDHPPLTFVFNYLSMSLFGDNLFAARFASAFCGVLSVVLIYLIANKIFNNRNLALLAMAIMSVNDYVVFYSRTALMESVTLFLILLGFYLFLLSLDNPKFLALFGAVVGLGCLSKYVTFVALPAYLAILLLYRRQYFKDYRLYLAIFIALAFFSPVIYYNYEMYRARGHFDFQFAYLFHQTTPEWPSDIAIGKNQRGDLLDRLQHNLRLSIYLSPVIILLVLSSLVNMFSRLHRLSVPMVATLVMFLAFFSATLLFGAERRFIYYYLPYLIILSAAFLHSMSAIFLNNRKRIITGLYGFVVIFELLFCVNTVFAKNLSQPVGWKNVTYASGIDIGVAGAEALDQYLKTELKNVIPVRRPDLRNVNLNALLSKHYNSAFVTGTKMDFVLINDDRIRTETYMWVLTRNSFMRGWNYLPLGGFAGLRSQDLLAKGNSEVVCYFIVTVAQTTRVGGDIPIIDFMESYLQQQTIYPAGVKSGEQLVYQVYKTDMKTMVAARNYAQQEIIKNTKKTQSASSTPNIL